MADDTYQRQEIQDPLAQRRGAPAQPNSIPLSGVQAPRRADFSQVGEGQRVIAKLLGDSAGLLDKYVDQNRQQWELDGKMAYAQGTAEEEIAKSGNKYTMAGFLTMKTQTAAQQFYTNELDDIDNKYRTISPEQYRSELMGRFKQVSEQAGDDPFVQRLLGASAADTFPKLVAQQTKSNNEWRKKETYSSSVGMMVSDGTLNDPQNPNGGFTGAELRERTKLATEALTNPDDKKAAVTEALTTTLKLKDRRLFDALSGSDQAQGDGGINVKDLPPAKQVMGQAIDYVIGIEGGYVPNDAGKGETKYGINKSANPDVDVANLTPDQARKIYEERYWNKVVTSDMPADMSIVAFDAAVNQGVGWTQEALKQAGGDVGKFLQLRRDRYIAIAQNDPTKAQYLDGWLNRLDKLQGAEQAGRPLQTTVNNLVSERKAILTMVANGFSESQINQVQSSYKQYMNDKDDDFDKNRYITEQSILNTAATEGNLPAQLDRIQTVKQTAGYSDKWANQMAEKAATQVQEYNKKQTENNRVDTAGLNGQLSFESGEKQKAAVDRYRSKLIGTWQAKPDLTDEQKNQGIRQEMTDYLVKNGVTDDVWKKNINVGLSGNIVRKDGSIDPAAAKAYKDYLWLKQNAPLAYAQQYLDGDAKKLIAQAEAMDVGMNSDQALLTASQMLTNKREGVESGTVAEPEVAKLIDKKVEDELNPGIFSFISRFQAADAFDVKDSDIAAAKKSPALKAYLTARANTLMQSDLTGRTTPEAAVNQAWNDTVGRIELAPSGNVLLSGPDKTIREELGFPNAGATNLVFKALQGYAAHYGKATFGPRYHGVTVDADKQFAMYKQSNPSAGTTGQDERWIFGKVRDELSGVHPSNYVYDPDRHGIHWQLLKEDDMGNMIPDGDPKFIPMSVLGGYMRQQQFAERSTRSLGDYVKNSLQDLKTQIVGKD